MNNDSKKTAKGISSLVNCDVIKDILPLYVENMVSNSSKQLVLMHLESCSDCKNLEENMHIQPDLSTISTNVSNSENPLQNFRKKMVRYSALLFSLGAFATIWLAILIWGLFFLQSGDEMAYSLLTFYFALPITSLICCIVIGKKDTRIKYLIPFLFGFAGTILPSFISHCGFDEIHLYFSIIPSAIGLLIGISIKYFKKKRRYN